MDEFSMFDIAKRFGWQFIDERKGSIVCPFCGAKGAKCGITDKLFNCFKCGQSGNCITIYADYMGLTDSGGLTRNQIAYRELKKMFGSDNYVSKRTARKTDFSEEKEPDAETKEPDAETLDAAYRKLLKHLELTAWHRKALNRRGFTDEQIDRIGFKSISPDCLNRAARALDKRDDSFYGIPGFYINKYNRLAISPWRTYGILCPCPNTDGQIVGFQIRMDKTDDRGKYIWMSSRGRKHGASPKSPCGFFGKKDADKFVVVDGILKAAVCSAFCKSDKVTFIGVPGVSCAKSFEKCLKSLPDVSGRLLVNAFDMDEFEKPDADNANKLKMLTKASGRVREIANAFGMRYKRATWNLDKNKIWKGGIKGLDDLALYKLKNGKSKGIEMSV